MLPLPLISHFYLTVNYFLIFFYCFIYLEQTASL